MKQKISGKWDFSHQKYNWEWEKQKPKYHQIIKMCGIWDGNEKWKKIIKGRGNGQLVENLFFMGKGKSPCFGGGQFFWNLGNDWDYWKYNFPCDLGPRWPPNHQKWKWDTFLSDTNYLAISERKSEKIPNSNKYCSGYMKLREMCKIFHAQMWNTPQTDR